MIELVLLIAAFLLLLAAALRLWATAPIDLVAAGLALAVLSMLIGRL